jgi:pimeloyl-ACP methyl ester carboxylesterase
MALQEKYFDHNGVKLYYFTLGLGKPLLFLPGGLRVSTYLTNIHYLAKWYKVIAVDLPGFGKSSTPKNVWGLEEYANILETFLHKKKLPALPIVGHSYGGGVGLYLSTRKGCASKMVAFSPMGVATDNSLFSFYFKGFVTKTINDYKALHTNRMRAFVFNNALSTLYGNLSAIPKMFQITNKCLYRNISPEELGKITIPVKLIWGTFDELFPVLNGKYLHRFIKKSELEIVTGNHDWWTLNPELGGDKVRAFIK